jgi:hypothetical protein
LTTESTLGMKKEEILCDGIPSRLHPFSLIIHNDAFGINPSPPFSDVTFTTEESPSQMMFLRTEGYPIIP